MFYVDSKIIDPLASQDENSTASCAVFVGSSLVPAVLYPSTMVSNSERQGLLHHEYRANRKKTNNMLSKRYYSSEQVIELYKLSTIEITTYSLLGASNVPAFHAQSKSLFVRILIIKLSNVHIKQL